MNMESVSDHDILVAFRAEVSTQLRYISNSVDGTVARVTVLENTVVKKDELARSNTERDKQLYDHLGELTKRIDNMERDTGALKTWRWTTAGSVAVLVPVAVWLTMQVLNGRGQAQDIQAAIRAEFERQDTVQVRTAP